MPAKNKAIEALEKQSRSIKAMTPKQAEELGRLLYTVCTGKEMPVRKRKR